MGPAAEEESQLDLAKSAGGGGWAAYPILCLVGVRTLVADEVVEHATMALCIDTPGKPAILRHLVQWPDSQT